MMKLGLNKYWGSQKYLCVWIKSVIPKEIGDSFVDVYIPKALLLSLIASIPSEECLEILQTNEILY